MDRRMRNWTEDLTGNEQRDWEEFARHCREELIPKIDDSAIIMSLVPDRTDVKFAVELGFAIMYDKPILALVPEGVTIPGHLARVADKIITVDLADPGAATDAMTVAIREMTHG